jgi:hypothetical protein
MPSKRTLLTRHHKPGIPAEAIELFRKAFEIQEAGEHEKWEEEGGRKSEYIAITKRLDWTLLKRLGEVSVLDDALDDEEMRPVNLHCGGAGWDDGVKLRKALMAAIGKRAA